MLNTKQRKRFRTIGHSLSPVVTIAGNGLSENVSGELDRALNDHELIKVKIVADDRNARRQLTEDLLSKHRADLVQAIGNIILIYRAAKKPNPALSNLSRSKLL